MKTLKEFREHNTETEIDEDFKSAVRNFGKSAAYAAKGFAKAMRGNQIDPSEMAHAAEQNTFALHQIAVKNKDKTMRKFVDKIENVQAAMRKHIKNRYKDEEEFRMTKQTAVIDDAEYDD